MNMLILSLWSKLILLHFLWNSFLDSFDCILQTQDSASLMCFLFPMYSNSKFVFPLVCIPSTVESPSILKLCTSKEHCLPASPSELLQQGDQCKENGNNFWASPVTEIWWCCNSSQVMQGKTSWIISCTCHLLKISFNSVFWEKLCIHLILSSVGSLLSMVSYLEWWKWAAHLSKWKKAAVTSLWTFGTCHS
jgi:hypothetical protein